MELESLGGYMGKVKNSDINVETIADFFLAKSKLSPKKLQKLVYYAYAWFITLYNEDPKEINSRLFDEHPQAWAHGPVFKSLYDKYKGYGWSEIEKKRKKISFEDSNIQSFMEDIWRKFHKYSADELEYMTHQEDPWKNARGALPPWAPSNNEISDKDIYIYYNAI